MNGVVVAEFVGIGTFAWPSAGRSSRGLEEPPKFAGKPVMFAMVSNVPIVNPTATKAARLEINGKRRAVLGG